MFKKNLCTSIIGLFIGISIIFNGYFIGNAVKNTQTKTLPTASVDSRVLNLQQVAEYLNIREEEIKGIIRVEKAELAKTGRFSGMRFPYFVINNKQYFSKNEIDEWLKEVILEYREYNTIEGWVLE